MRVLFIGNSYIFENDLPGLFADLARAGKHAVTVESVANGGWTLEQHQNAVETRAKLKSQAWDIVVLQEQSVIPALPNERVQKMYPAIRELHREVQARGARTMLFLTWGRRDGLAEARFTNYAAMQLQLTKGYTRIADELRLAVAPVGLAWERAHREQPRLELWQADGSHPSRIGSYLAACVFYAAIFKQSPEGLPAAAGVPDATAAYLQKLAADTVLANPAQWHLP